MTDPTQPLPPVVHVNEEAERELLGYLLVRTGDMGMVLNDARLEADHFYFEKHQLIFAVMTSLYEEGIMGDQVAVAAELAKAPNPNQRFDANYIAELAAMFRAGNPLHHAKLIQEEAKWRHYIHCGQMLQIAANAANQEALAQAEAELARDVVRSGDTSDPAAILHRLRERLAAEKADIFPWPLRGLNDRTGGLARGEFVVLGGWTSHGKSVFCDQLLETVAKRGFRTHLYINEMSEPQRVARMISRRTGINFKDVMNNRLSAQAEDEVIKAASEIRFGITEVHGWSASEIAHHIRQNRYDLVVVDLLHEISYETENDLRQIISTLRRAALQANCCVVAAAHLSEHRAHQKADLPPPVLSDLRGSGMIKNAADFVVFVYVKPGEEETESFHPDGDGLIYIAKGRNVGTGTFGARLAPGRFQWEPIDHTTTATMPGTVGVPAADGPPEGTFLWPEPGDDDRPL